MTSYDSGKTFLAFIFMCGSFCGRWLTHSRKRSMRISRLAKNSTPKQSLSLPSHQYRIGSHKTVRAGLLQDCAFKSLRQFNCTEGRIWAGKRHRLSIKDFREIPTVDKWFPSDSMTDQLARSLASYCAIDMKEFSESMEFFQKTRQHFKKTRVIVDLCCGHGFTGMLFALFVRGALGIFH